MGARVKTLYGGFRVEVTLEALTFPPSVPVAPGGNRNYKFILDVAGGSFALNGSKPVRIGPSGLMTVQTQETFQDQSASLEFAWGDVARALEGMVNLNDILTVKIGGIGDDLRVAFVGLVSNMAYSAQSTPGGVKKGFTVQAQGIRKLFTQSIYNWQGVLAQGDDVLVSEEALLAFQDLVSSGSYQKDPREIIKAFVKIGVANSVHALYQGARIAPGGLFDFASDGNWASMFDPENYPLTGATINKTWDGDLWSLLQSLVYTDLHEFFWSYGEGEDGNEKPLLVHRPRPFPYADPSDPDKGASGWAALDCLTLGKDGMPGALGVMRQRADAGRVNAFHWSQESGFQDSDPGTPSTKLALGWWADQRGIAKYGFSPRPVRLGVFPRDGEDFMDGLASMLLRVASMEAGLYLMGNESRSYGTLLPGLHVGTALEDWTEGFPSTGYVSSVSHLYKSVNRGISASSTVGLSRCLPCSNADYPNAALGLFSLERVGYSQKNQTTPDGQHPAKIALQACHAPASFNAPNIACTK